MIRALTYLDHPHNYGEMNLNEYGRRSINLLTIEDGRLGRANKGKPTVEYRLHPGTLNCELVMFCALRFAARCFMTESTMLHDLKHDALWLARCFMTCSTVFYDLQHDALWLAARYFMTCSTMLHDLQHDTLSLAERCFMTCSTALSHAARCFMTCSAMLYDLQLTVLRLEALCFMTCSKILYDLQHDTPWLASPCTCFMTCSTMLHDLKHDALWLAARLFMTRSLVL